MWFISLAFRFSVLFLIVDIPHPCPVPNRRIIKRPPKEKGMILVQVPFTQCFGHNVQYLGEYATGKNTHSSTPATLSTRPENFIPLTGRALESIQKAGVVRLGHSHWVGKLPIRLCHFHGYFSPGKTWKKGLDWRTSQPAEAHLL